MQPGTLQDSRNWMRSKGQDVAHPSSIRESLNEAGLDVEVVK